MLSNPHSVFGAPRGEASVPRPLKTYLPQGEVLSAWKCKEVPYAGVHQRRSGAQRAGLVYQRRVGKLLPLFGAHWNVVHGPWYAFTDASSGRHYCQPDFILVPLDGGPSVVVEVKLRWTSDAWWQLRKLYQPVLRKASSSEGSVPRVLTICRSYDPAVCIPEEVILISSLEEVQEGSFNVMVVK